MKNNVGGCSHTEAVASVADGSRTIARVEAAPEKTAAACLEDGKEIVTNFFMLEEMKHLDKGCPEDNIVYEFHRRVKRWFQENKGSVAVERANAFCSDPKKGIYQYLDKFEEVAIWSCIAETSPAAVELAPCPPCDTDYMNL